MYYILKFVSRLPQIHMLKPNSQCNGIWKVGVLRGLHYECNECPYWEEKKTQKQKQSSLNPSAT